MVYRVGGGCPGCGGELHEQRIARYQVERCHECHGIWTTTGIFDSIVGEVLPGSKVQLLRARVDEPQKSCPVCRAQMSKASAGPLAVDVCEHHGIWFDTHELESLVNTVAGQDYMTDDRDQSLIHDLFTGKPRP